MSGDLLLVLAAATPGDYLQVQHLFDPQYLFQPVPALASQIRPIFEVLAFLILAATGVRRWLHNPHDPLMGVVPVVIAGLMIAIIPFLLNTADDAVDDLVSKSGMADPSAVFARLLALSQPFRPMNKGEEVNIKKLDAVKANADQYAQEQVRQHMFWGIDFTPAVNFIKNVYDGTATALHAAFDTVKDPMGAVEDSLKQWLFKAISVLGAGLVWVLMQICGLICYVFISIRYLLVHLESIVLPAFIAMMVTDALRSQGYNFVLQLGGIVLWPLGWALGHVGTLAIASWFASILAAELGLQNGNANLVDGQIFDWVLNGDALGLGFATPQTQCCIIITASFGAIILCIWVVLVTFCCPFVVARALRGGSGIFGDMVGGTAKGALALSGAALQVAAAAMGAAAVGRAANGAGGNNAAPTGGGDQAPTPSAGPAGGGLPIGANAGAALANLAQRATTQPTPGTGGMYAVSPSGRAAFIPMSRNQMQSLLAGNGLANGGGNGGQLANGGPGPGNDGGGSGAGNGSQSRPPMRAASRAGYRFTMAAAGLSALGGALTAASQSDGSPGSLASVPTSAASSGVDRAERTRHMQDAILDRRRKDTA
jgi:hypothetical protein